MTKRGLYTAMLLSFLGAWVFSRVVVPRAEAGSPAGLPTRLAIQTPVGIRPVSALKGHVVVVDFCASWSMPSLVSMPHLDQMYRRLHPRGLEVVGVCLDDDEAAAAQLSSVTRVTYPVGPALDPQAAQAYAGDEPPVRLLIDRDGRVVWRQSAFGPAADDELATRAEALLAAGSGRWR